MANIKFVWQALDDATITTSTGTASGYSLRNLNDRDPAKIWKDSSTSAGSHYLNFDLGSARSCNTCIVQNANFSSSGATYVALQYSSTGNVNEYTTAGTFSLTDSTQSLEFTSQNYRYWRLDLFDTGWAAAPQVGNLFLGTRLELTQPYNSNFETSSRFTTSQVRAIDGTRYSTQLYNGLKTWKLKWTNINSTDKGYLQTLFDGIRGSYYPFYFIDADASINLVYSTNDENPIQTKANGIFDSGELSLEAFSINT